MTTVLQHGVLFDDLRLAPGGMERWAHSQSTEATFRHQSFNAGTIETTTIFTSK